jgi:hypothetical protein
MTPPSALTHVALGGAGLGSLLIHLIIWHELWRLVRFLWHIHTFGPYIVILLGLLVAGALVWRRHRGGWRFGRRGGLTGYGSGSGPRDW